MPEGALERLPQKFALAAPIVASRHFPRKRGKIPGNVELNVRIPLVRGGGPRAGASETP